MLKETINFLSRRPRESCKESRAKEGTFKKAVPSLDSPLLRITAAEMIASKKRS